VPAGTAVLQTATTSFSTGDWFQVKMAHSGAEKILGLYITSDNPNKIQVFNQGVYDCLSDIEPVMDEDAGKWAEVLVSGGNNVCAISASLNQGTGQKHLESRLPNCQITLVKKLP
jgi:hypothetical protein